MANPPWRSTEDVESGATSDCLDIVLEITPIVPMAERDRGRDDDERDGGARDRDGGDGGAERRGKRPPANVEDMITLKVDNIPHAATIDEVKEVFDR